MSSNALWIALFCFSAIYALYLRIKINSKNKSGLTLDKLIEEKHKELLKLKEEQRVLTSEYDGTKEKLHSLLELERNSDELASKNKELESEKHQLGLDIGELTTTKQSLESEIKARRNKINTLKSDLSVYSDDMKLISRGHVPEPKYMFKNSERYKAELKHIRSQQAQMIKSKEAVELPDNIALITDDSYTKKVLDGQSKLMLKAFNLECDTLLDNLKSTNYPATLERIERSANEVEQNAISLEAGLSNRYVELKFRECELQYQYKKLEYEEKMEQAAIKEQLREEAKVRAEAERLQREAGREEDSARRALAKALENLDRAADDQKSQYEAIIAELRIKLKEAEEKNQRALSMAQQTKSGHVYIISNIGSFGENVFKIGMTRRLEPMDRVKELGDASVPFEFDVHAMIYSEDAPALERRMHEAFQEKRANLTNPRKEFFYVSIDEIEEWAENNDLDLELTKLAEARTYKDSEAIRLRLSAGEEVDLPEEEEENPLDSSEDDEEAS